MGGPGVGVAELPREVLRAIWCDEAISPREICALACVCHRFSDFGKGRDVGDLWKVKLGQRFRSLSPGHVTASPLPRTVSFYEYKTRCIVARDVDAFLARLAADFRPNSHDTQEDSEVLEEICAYAAATAATTQHAIDALTDILATGNSRRRDLNRKAYARMALRRVRAAALAPVVRAYRTLPRAAQSLEVAAAHVAQYFQPFLTVTVDAVSTQMDGIARRVRAALPEGHPAKAGRPDGPGLGDADAQSALSTLNAVLFTELGFRGNAEDYYDVRNSMINVVLERRLGIPITLSVVYAAVAGRLGVTCAAVNFPGHVLLKWERWGDGGGADREVYIDAFHNGAQKSREECLAMVRAPAHDASAFRTVPGGKMMERMVRNLIMIGQRTSNRDGSIKFLQTALALSVLASDTAFEERLLLARIYLHHETNLKEVKEILQPLVPQLNLSSQVSEEASNALSQIQQMINRAETLHTIKENERNPEVEPKLRSDPDNSKVLYTTGQIMYHRRYHYHCVISGWDPVCTASTAWIRQMGVDRLPDGPGQPFYNVLVADGSTRYAAQGSLRPADVPTPISHPDVGRHFTAFRGTLYVPTDKLRSAYPEDAERPALKEEEEEDNDSAFSDDDWDAGLPPSEASRVI